ncbi:MAG TPA: HEAT repeat domain-containing protein [Candidatus Handelsmanbacteria bacterium]|nr:HEAT repeat domain-containing protein [Candidatus Handelsmanbacteria bacterium]
MYRIVLLAAVLALPGCTNVNQMHKLYLEGNDEQLYKIMEIVSRQDYPYATRRKAARILGEIGDRRAVPVLSNALHSYEQRTTLKQDALRALGAIGDQSATPDIGRLLDRSLNTADAELRMAAVEALGTMGGAKSAEILVNALSYYSILILRNEQRTQKGVFTGEEQSYPFGPAGADSTGGSRRYPNVGIDPFGQGGEPRISMFGTPIERSQMQYNPTAEERTLAHDALVSVGEEAIPEIEDYMGNNRLHPTMRKQLLSIIAEIRGDPPSDTSDSTAVY